VRWDTKNGTKIAQTFAFYHWRKEKKCIG